MPSVIQELAGEEVTLNAAHVEARVADWKHRLADLYDQIMTWLPHLTSHQTDAAEMDEILMRQYGVPPTTLPVLEILDGNNHVATLIPNGLWIIGSNGRVDLQSKNGRYLINNRSDYFLPSHWEIAPSLDRLKSEPFSRDSLLKAIQ